MKNQIEKSNLLAEVELTYKSKIKASDRIRVNSSINVTDYFKSIWDYNKIEHVEESYILFLNRANEILGWAKLSSGGTTSTVVDPKLIFQLSLLHNASSIILAHNHPSGNLKASPEDISMTRKIKDGGKLLDINLLDHIIMSSEGSLSFLDEGISF